MTIPAIEEANRRALQAAESGDSDTLGAALDARATAIAALVRLEPSPELAQHLASAIQTGKVLNNALSALKARIRTEGGRAAQLQAGLSAGLAAPPKTHIDYHG
jgi:hypothetical protein